MQSFFCVRGSIDCTTLGVSVDGQGGERLARAVRDQELIFIHWRLRRRRNLLDDSAHARHSRVRREGDAFHSRRIEDGYDLSDAGVDAANGSGAKVVVTCDCGTSAVAPVARLCRAGIDVIVTDHHLPGGDLPDCLAVLNPKRSGCGYPDKDLAAVGVAFKLALALARALEKNENFVWAMMDLVALATVADVAPLLGGTESSFDTGSKCWPTLETSNARADQSRRPRWKAADRRRIGFILAPRLNAAGRLGHAMRGVELLLSETSTKERDRPRARELNYKRQELITRRWNRRERDSSARSRRSLRDRLADEAWHPGVIGIVASRLVRSLGARRSSSPSPGDQGKVRPIDLQISIFTARLVIARVPAALWRQSRCSGCDGRARSGRRFAARFKEVARSLLTPEDLVPEIRVDLEVSMDGMDQKIESLFRHFEPFGIGNPAPVLLARNVTIARPPRLIGRDGLKLALDTGTGSLEAIGWGFAPRAGEFVPGSKVDIAFRLERDEYRGESYLQARIADIRASEGS